MECYKSLLQPNYGAEDVFKVILDVLRDCLCFFASRLTFYDVWQMKEYGNEGSWAKLFRVPVMEQNPFGIHPLWLSEDDQVLLSTLLRGRTLKLLAVYDSKNGTFKFPKIQNINCAATPKICIESLIPPCF